MLNKFTVLLLLAGLTVFYACKDKVVDNPIPNKPPTTKLFLNADFNPDSLIANQQSKIHLYWSGDDPDGQVVGFYFSWDGVNWTYTTKNDSLFSLQIGAVDSIFAFRVSAVDNLGLRDPNPARLKLQIKNTAPTVTWDILSTHPDTSFTVMTFGWDAKDIDGDNTIQHINIAINDTNKFVALNGTVSVVTIRTNDYTNSLMDIYINGDNTIEPKDSAGNKLKLSGLLYNSNNTFYVQAEDISGAKSPWISSATQPNSKPGWFVKKPKGNIALVNNYSAIDNSLGSFYPKMMDSLNLTGRYDIIDLVNQKPPYINITFLETVKLFKGILWYTDNAPSLDLAGATVQKITAAGVKIFFSMLFPQPQQDDLNVIQQFLPILNDTSYYLASIAPGKVVSDISHSGYPTLKVATSFYRVRSFHFNPSVTPIYYFPNSELSGYIGFENKSQNGPNIFFIGLPLHKMNGAPGVKDLLDKVLFHDFNIQP